MDIPWALPHIGDEELDEVVDCVESTWVTMGPRVEEFEVKLADYVGVDHAIAVNSGTAALDVALKALEINADDEVVVPTMTYIATANAVKYQHATPAFADIDPETYNLDPSAAESNITTNTTALLPIDYGGQCADYDRLREIADENDLHLVGDAAESLSAKQNEKMAGSLADISITSFHAAKLMTSVEGGMVFTDDKELAEKCRVIRSQGEDSNAKYHHPELGHNYRMSDLHASIGLAQFRRIDEITEKRTEIAEYYGEHLAPLADDIVLPSVKDKNEHAWFLYSILTENRDQVQAYLEENGVGTRAPWPIPAHKQPVFEGEHGDERYPIAERFCDGVLSLPMYHEMDREEMEYVVETVREAIDLHVDEKYELKPPQGEA